MGALKETLDLLQGQQVYLDNNIFIYFLDRNPDYFPFVQPIIEAVASGSIIGCTGDAVIAEILVKPYQSGNFQLVASIKSFFRSENFLSVYSHNAEAFDLAAQLRARYNQKFIDALHYATAIIAGCKFIITNDSGIKSNNLIEVIHLSALLAK
ncbi:type II toxin-antitoxin system VapC family toxin [Chlorobium sp. BLA1]|uniref:type II toxin-antitoxin system VapC family toxin n=1 Tax=Candidatus Chlorobium masyuteum TaxID=2716876 RepID=UPI00142321AE|nr:type II toxin-antitoxin system VapC family toxin [Candidatus Chlorobium masyuteum]NHQ58990.1 type II toxin-antitoxin system VapC family toxin [Candidatus Chlorobium masyuteum]NTU44401.1 type II toxin-antitoxin system VapC family toxin [Chlorobiaceae bacterium]